MRQPIAMINNIKLGINIAYAFGDKQTAIKGNWITRKLKAPLLAILVN